MFKKIGAVMRELFSETKKGNHYFSYKNLKRFQIIQKIIDETHAKTYLEIGISDGTCFEKINCDFKIGVDPCAPYKKSFSEGEKYFQMTSDDFFTNQENISSIVKRGIDVVFIDGLHEYKQVMRDVDNCLHYLNRDGYIVLHDCNPPGEVQSIKAFSYLEAEEIAHKRGLSWNGEWMGDVWKAILVLKNRKDLDVCVLDCDCGLGIVRRNYDSPKLDIEKLDYNFLQKNRKKILNLKNPIIIWILFLAHRIYKRKKNDF